MKLVLRNGLLIVPNVIAILILIGLFSTAPVYMKTSSFRSRVLSREITLIFSLIIVVAFVVVSLSEFTRIWQFVLNLLQSQYVFQYHKFWIGLGVGIFYLFMFRRIKSNNREFEFLDSFKTFPLVSPIFCFGAPVFWESSLIILGVSLQSAKFLGLISFMSGIAFLSGLLVFYGFIQPMREKNVLQKNILISGMVSQSKRLYTTESVSLFFIFLGMGLLTFIIFEITYMALAS